MSARSSVGAVPAPSVLIVEDEILIGLGLAMALNVAGHRVHGPTGSVRRALSIAAMNGSAAVVLESTMINSLTRLNGGCLRAT